MSIREDRGHRQALYNLTCHHSEHVCQKKCAQNNLKVRRRGGAAALEADW